MATKTAGTLATTTLTALQSYASDAAADVATIAQAIKDDINVAHPTWPGAYVLNGFLYVPNRGVLKVLPGDWVGVDPQGWPILISSNSLAKTLTATGDTNTDTSITNLSANVIAQGWKPGMAITGTDIDTDTTIAAIASDGLSLTLSKAATGTGTARTLTVGSWTHS